MNKIIFLIKVTAIIAFTCSCKNTKVITGRISEINGREVKVSGKKFLIPESAPMPLLNQVCTFTPTKDSSKVNSIIITKN